MRICSEQCRHQLKPHQWDNARNRQRLPAGGRRRWQVAAGRPPRGACGAGGRCSTDLHLLPSRSLSSYLPSEVIACRTRMLAINRKRAPCLLPYQHNARGAIYAGLHRSPHGPRPDECSDDGSWYHRSDARSINRRNLTIVGMVVAGGGVAGGGASLLLGEGNNGSQSKKRRRHAGGQTEVPATPTSTPPRTRSRHGGEEGGHPGHPAPRQR